ncbi:hypothetical protein SDC9_124185 [bioreactor metagenome]|uniref:Uncharacterized protein n=1 Tax=bioreactor metagenome TaxID=1076179 RepID=A0A645CJR8_9ZZZZ
MEAGAFDRHLSNAANVQQMSQLVAIARCVAEHTVVNVEFGILEVGGQETVLIVIEHAIAYGQAAALEADAGTVAIRHPGAAELDVVHLELAVAKHPDGLAFCMHSVCDQYWATPYAADFELLLLPDGDISTVSACLDQHDVAVPGDTRCVR